MPFDKGRPKSTNREQKKHKHFWRKTPKSLSQKKKPVGNTNIIV